MKKNLLSVLLSVILVCAAGFTAGADADPASAQVSDGYELIAQNNGYRLYAELSTGDFALFDIAADRMWYSGQWEVLDDESPVSELNSGRIKTDLVSMVAVSYVQVSTVASTAVPSYQNSYAYSVIKNNVTAKRIENGYCAEYYFADLDSTVAVEITLTDGGIEARIPAEKLKIGEEYRIISIDLLPGFLAADDRWEGYLFVPSGSGGIIPLGSAKGDIAEFEEMVYGGDTAVRAEEYTGETQNILIPAYGIKCGDSAVAAFITHGDTSASIAAQADSSTTSFSRVYSRYVTAVVDSTTLFESNYENQRVIYGVEARSEFEDYAVSFTFLHGAQADYSGMAKVCREQLALEKRTCEPQLALTLYGAATKKASFLGIPYTKTVALTTYEQAQRIVSDFNAQDIPVALKYVGWNNNGVENKKIPVKVSPVGVLGGKKKYNALQEFLDDSENSAYFDVDFMNIRKSGNGFSVLSDVCRSIFNTRTPIYKYMRSVYVPVNTENPSYLLKPAEAAAAAQKFLSVYSGKGGLSLDGFGEQLYSDFSKKGCTRAQALALFEQTLEKAAADHSVSVNTGNAYTYRYADRIFELPTSNDGNLLFSQSVPFVQMVLHGSIPYSVQTGDSLADCLEFGGDPSFAGIYADDSTLIDTSFNWLYGSTLESWRAEAESVYKAYASVYHSIYDQAMISHRAENGVSVTEYENGVKVYVNRTEKDAVFEGTAVPADGYVVTGGADG